MQERIVVTGIGTINPLGKSVAESWKNVVEGVPGVGPITLCDTSDLLVKIACEVKNFDPNEFLHPREIRRRDRFQQFSSIAAAEAISQSGLNADDHNPQRIGAIFSSAIGGFNTFVEGERIRIEEGARKVSPFIIPMLMANGAAGLITIDYGFQGPSFSVASACASSADGIGTAWSLLRMGVVDAVVTGGAEATITSLAIAAFDRIGAMSRRDPDSLKTPQPFDLNRDGLVMGEGAAALVLELESHAKQRGAEIIAEMAGYAATSDGFHITAPSEDGSGGARAIQQCLEIAGEPPDRVDYINAHGTATELNDLSETKAIKLALGNHAREVQISSTKSMTGHMMGATGAVEAVFCIKAIQDGVIPPTIHYETPDPDCDLDYVPNQARDTSVGLVLSNAFGFGGHNSVLAFRKYN